MVDVYDDRPPETLGEYEYRPGGRAVKPKDAATLVIIRRDGNKPRVLMGRRAAGHKFMPNKYVFPGGRVGPGDDRLRPPHDLRPEVVERLARHCSERRARGLARAGHEGGGHAGAAGTELDDRRGPAGSLLETADTT